MKTNYSKNRSLFRVVDRFKNVLLSIPLIFIGFISFGQLGTIQIGSGTATSNGSQAIPVTNYDYNYSQQIVTAAEYAAGGGVAGNITKIRYYVTNTGTPTVWDNWTVYLGNTTRTSFSSTTDWEPVASLTQVFSGTIVPVANGWFEITFTTPFNYTGGNLIVAVDENSDDYSSSPTFRSYTSATNTGILSRVDNTNSDPATPPTADELVSVLPQIQFEGTLASCSPPYDLGTSNLTNSSATLIWTENGTATEWDIEYGVAGFTPTGTPTVSGTTNPAPISGLTANTSYEFYVRSVCSLTDVSAWVGPYSFYTGYCLVNTLYTSDYTSVFSTSGAVDNVSYSASSQAPGSYSDETAQVFNSFASQEINYTHSYVGGNNSHKIWIDWNNDFDFDDAGEEVSSFLAVTSPHSGSFIVPVGTPIGSYTVRFRSVYDYFGSENVTPCGTVNYGSTIDFLLNVTAPPSCLPPSVLTASGLTPYTADLSWAENGTATEWDIEYGLIGFTPTGIPTEAGITNNPVAITGLNPSSTYQFYVRSICSLTDASTWSGPYSFITLCAPITALPWTENFDNMTTVDYDLFPPCWVAEATFEWSTNDDPTSSFNAGPLSPTNFLSAGYYSDSKIWTPEFDLVAGETYEFSFNWAGDGATSWEGSVFVNNTQESAGATMIGTTFIEAGDANPLSYKREIYCFTPTVSGIYTFGIYAVDDGSDWNANSLNFDDFGLKQVIATPGVDGSLSTCQTGTPVDLNTVITTSVTDGTWNFDINPNAVNVNMFNTTNLATGTYEVLYLVGGCIPDTTVATITVVKPSSAGSDGSIAVCRNQPFNLLSGLVGNADFGGVWTDPNAAVVPNGNATSGNLPGQYNYKYIVSNGVCPADTAKVVVNVQGCDFLGLEDLAFEGFNLYPNPTSDLIFIINSGSAEVFNYEVLDMNGRVILSANDAINGTTTTEINLNTIQNGVYMVRVFNENANKTFRVVKN